MLGLAGREDLVVAVVIKDTYLPSDSMMCSGEPWGREPGGPQRLGCYLTANSFASTSVLFKLALESSPD